MDPEERELTIKIANLNADLQVHLAYDLGLLAVSIASFVASYQFFDMARSNSVYSSVASFLLILALFTMAAAAVFQSKLQQTRQKLRNLK